MWEQLLISMLPGLISMIAGKDSKVSNLASLFGQGYQTAQNYQNQQENQDWQRNFAMQQFNYNSMLNDRSFFHSLPASQVEHYKKAGLSPDLLYGQMSSMNFGHNQSLQMPSSPAPNFAGLENANLSKDLSKKDTEIGLNLSQTEINKIDKNLKSLEEAFHTMVDGHRINREALQTEFVKLNNQLVQSNVEKNVIDNMKMAAALGLVRGIDEDGNIVYTTSAKFDEIAELYLSDLRQKYNLQEADYHKALADYQKIFKQMQAIDSEIMINSVAYQQDVMNLIASAVGAGIDLKQNENGEWVVNYTGSTGDVAGIVAMGLIDSVLSAVGIKFTLGKNASKVLGKHETKTKKVRRKRKWLIES